MSEITKIAEQLNQKVSKLNNERSRQLGMQEAAKKQYDKAVEVYETKYGVKLSPENLQQEYNKIYAELKTNMEVLKRTIEGIERGDYKETTIPNIDLEPEVEITIPEEKVAVKEEVKQVVQPQTQVIQPQTVVQESKPEVTFEPIVEEKQEVDFGGAFEDVELPTFGGFNFGGEEVVSESKVEETPVFGGFNFGGEETVAQPVVETKEEEPVFGGFDLSALIEEPDNKAPVVNKQGSEKPKIPTDFVQPAPPKYDTGVEDLEEEESFTPEGWGTPKTNEDINKSFADILGSQGIKFGE